MIKKIKAEIGKVIIEQEEAIELVLITILSRGHALIEGVPGVGKTMIIKVLAKLMGIDFNRIQFTPDLMASDITGLSVFNMKNQEFEFKKGPIFTNLFLGDEINRTSPKTQAGLLEVMEERKITMDSHEYELKEPFVVFATQNPSEFEGTYNLSEALIDRFSIKIGMSYPSLKGEIKMLEKFNDGFDKNLNSSDIEKIVSSEEILELQKKVKQLIVKEELLEYIANIIRLTRENPFIEIGASPRASIDLLNASKACAFIDERDYIIPEDIKRMVKPVLGHRLVLKPEAYIEGININKLLEQILEKVSIPR